MTNDHAKNMQDDIIETSGLFLWNSLFIVLYNVCKLSINLKIVLKTKQTISNFRFQFNFLYQKPYFYICKRQGNVPCPKFGHLPVTKNILIFARE